MAMDWIEMLEWYFEALKIEKVKIEAAALRL